MAFDTIIDKDRLEASLRSTADAIRAKSGLTGSLDWNLDTGFASAIQELNLTSPEATEFFTSTEIPSYVKTEALRVASAVQSVRTDDSIVFLAMSDNHHYGNQKDTDTYPDSNGIQTNTSNKHAAMAAKVLAYNLDFDFMAQLGDVTWGSTTTSPDILKQQGDEFVTFLRDAHHGIPCFHAIGNHDTGIYYHNSMNDPSNKAGAVGTYTLDGRWLFNKFTALSNSEYTNTAGEDYGGYCYRDFENKKLRVFLLNTSEGLIRDQRDTATYGSQRKWLAEALLQLNTKDDADMWKFIVLSHYPADYGGTITLSNLLGAYVNGTDITIHLEDGTSCTKDFATKNKAKFIAQFHGHIHNHLAVPLSLQNPDKSYSTYGAWRMCVPNGQVARENTYTDDNVILNDPYDAEKYSKRPGTAKETIFTVNVIDPNKQVISSICYGAGTNRTINYGNFVFYSVSTDLTNCSLSSTRANVEKGQPFSTDIIVNNQCALTSAEILMDDTDITSSALTAGNTIYIPEVTGNLVIRLKAEIALACTNQIVRSLNKDGYPIYNGIGYKINTAANWSVNGEFDYNGMNGVSVTGCIPCKFGDTIRLYNMPFNANASGCRITYYTADSAGRPVYASQTMSTAYYILNTLEAKWDSADGSYAADANLVSFKLKQSGSINMPEDCAFVRITAASIDSTSVVTVNEELQYADELDSPSYTIMYVLQDAISTCAPAAVIADTPYYTTIKARGGHIIDSISVIMDGKDITASVCSGTVISIPKVTGTVVITVRTKEDPGTAPYTNQLSIATDLNGDIYNGVGYAKGTYLSSGNEGADSSRYVTGFIPIKPNSYGTAYFYLKNVKFIPGAYHNRVYVYNQDKSVYSKNEANTTDTTKIKVDESGRLTEFYIVSTQRPAADESGNCGYIRLCCDGLTSESIITSGEPII